VATEESSCIRFLPAAVCAPFIVVPYIRPIVRGGDEDLDLRPRMGTRQGF
jgi:hypothetical protein